MGWVFVGGALGAGMRLFAESAAHHLKLFYGAFPWGTLVVNILGCFGLGLLEGAVHQEKALLFILGSGIIAGFTTFSTLMLETLNLAAAKEHDRAFFNILGSVSLGLPALYLGIHLGTGV